MRPVKKDYLLYAVTDRSWLRGGTLFEQVQETLKHGTTFLQLREKEMAKEDFMAEARQIKGLTDTMRIPFVINDNIDVALAVDADGAHIGQSDIAVTEARHLLGPDKILGVSAQTVAEALLAEKQGADYLGVGAVFPTSTKTDADAVSLATLKEICAAVSIPVVAIGGIGLHNIEQLTGSGIAGVAVVSAIFAANDIADVSKKLREKCEQCFA